MTTRTLILCAAIGYALGNISTGLLIGRAFGVQDIRKTGSGNAGTTNVLRSLGLLPSALTLLGDLLKGLAASLAGLALGGTAGLLTAGIAAVIGHDFPAAFGFKGGKGVATSLGVIIAVNPLLALAVFVLQLTVAALTGYMSVASLINAAAFPFLIVLLYRGSPEFVLLETGAVVISALALFGHRANIARLVKGRENKLDFDSISEKSKNLRRKHK